MSRATEFAWAAGFIDGEGSFLPHQHNGAPFLAVTQVNPEALFKLQRLMGGVVKGPYSPPKHKGQPYYRYRLGVVELRKAIPELWPYLCGPKRWQYFSRVKHPLEDL
jgi:hypothetical protein